MSEFKERLSELMFDNNLSAKEFASNSGIDEACISFYLQGKSMPSVESLIKIAEYFNCSTDFLLGREEENKSIIFKTCPPFSERLKFLKNYYNCSSYKIYHNTKVAKSSYYDWLSGRRQPMLDNVIRLADLFGCRVDFVLGRE